MVSGPSAWMSVSSASAMRMENSQLGLARLVAAVVVRKLGVLEMGERQTEAGVHVRLAGEADGGAGVAVVGHAAAR